MDIDRSVDREAMRRALERVVALCDEPGPRTVEEAREVAKRALDRRAKLTWTDERRPINRDDLTRIRMLIEAASIREAEPETPLWEHLHDTHKDRGDSLQEPIDVEATGERFLAQEVQHANYVLETLAWHDGTMPLRPLNQVNTVCATPGCPNLAIWIYCWDCQMRREGLIE